MPQDSRLQEGTREPRWDHGTEHRLAGPAGSRLQRGKGLPPARIPATAAVAFVRLEDADKKGIEFECYANRNICVLKSVLSSWYI